jgi:hypothetical protein
VERQRRALIRRSAQQDRFGQGICANLDAGVRIRLDEEGQDAIKQNPNLF